jgi:hypothetical protein
VFLQHGRLFNELWKAISPVWSEFQSKFSLPAVGTLVQGFSYKNDEEEYVAAIALIPV